MDSVTAGHGMNPPTSQDDQMAATETVKTADDVPAAIAKTVATEV